MKKRFLYLLLPIISLILEALPFGAVLNFATPEGTPWRETYSYFSLIPFGYANVAPLFTAIITCIVFLLLIIYCIIGKPRMALRARNILFVCVILSLGPLVFGIRYLSFVGILITITLTAELFLLHVTVKK